MKYKKHTWFNLDSGYVEYGIQVFHGGRWLHCLEGDKILIFRDETERDVKLKELRMK